MDTVHITKDNSFFYNGNIDPDYNCLNSYTANSSFSFFGMLKMLFFGLLLISVLL